MLKYLIQVTNDLLTTGILISLIFVFLSSLENGTKKKCIGFYCGAALGTIASAAMAVIKMNTKLLANTASINLTILSISLAALLCFFVSWLIFGVLKKNEKRKELFLNIFAAVLVFTYMIYVVPGFLIYPFGFVLSNETVLSTKFLFSLIGYLLGFLITVLIAIYIGRAYSQITKKKGNILFSALLIINGLWQTPIVMQALIRKKILPRDGIFFDIVKYSVNNGDIFIYIVLAVSFIFAIILLIENTKIRDEWDNPAEHRKLIARQRKNIRNFVWIVILYICSIIIMTVLYSIENAEVELSPSEPYEDAADEVRVPLENVEDGHLHRFTYETKDGIGVRFIVIKKPNASSYGIGLDACDICGETGYYERNGQVVCKKCDVVMNINTIGFKGGCNPIPIDYKVSDGYISITKAALEEKKSKFK